MDGRITPPAPVVLVGDLKDLLTWSFDTVSPGVVSDRAYAGTAFLGTVQLGVLSVSCSLLFVQIHLLLKLLDPMHPAEVAAPPGFRPPPPPSLRRGTRASTSTNADDTLVPAGSLVVRRSRTRSRSAFSRSERRSRSPTRDSPEGGWFTPPARQPSPGGGRSFVRVELPIHQPAEGGGAAEPTRQPSENHGESSLL